MSEDKQQQLTKSWDTKSKSDLAKLIRDRDIDPYDHSSEYIKKVYTDYFPDQVQKNFYPNYCQFVKKFILGKSKDGARRRAAESAGMFISTYVCSFLQAFHHPDLSPFLLSFL
jgi:hypothetical protein